MKINVLGDSITIGAVASSPDTMFCTVLSKELNCEVNCYGCGGSRIAEQKEHKEEWDEASFLSRADDMEKDADYVFVFGGTNDYGHGDADFGNMLDRDVHTFFGALHALIRKLLQTWRPDQITFILPLRRYKENVSCPEGEKKDNPGLEQYRLAIKQVCGFYGIVYVDFRDSFPIPQTNEPSRYYGDGLHPTDVGHSVIAQRIAIYIKNRYLEPKNVQYINL